MTVSEMLSEEHVFRSLCEAGRRLRERSAAEIVALLGQALERFRDPASSPRRELENALPEATGFSKALVLEGLERGFAPWSDSAFRDLIASECGPLASLDARNFRTRLTGFEVTAVSLAGTIPMPTLLAMILPLALRSAVWVKCSRHDPVTAPLVAATLGALDPELGKCVAIFRDGHDQWPALLRRFEVPCVVAYGADPTIASISDALAPHQRFVGYGHRFSLAFLGDEALGPNQASEVLERVALDIALWDQLGCLSPVGIYVLSSDPRALQRVGEVLATALAAAERRWPRGQITLETAAAIREARGEAEARSLADRRVILHQSHDTAWTVVCEADAVLRSVPLHRFVRIYPLESILRLARSLRSVAPNLACAACEGLGEAQPATIRTLLELGVSRICRPGQMQAPPLSWHHDNQPLLSPMGRLTDLEFP